MNFVLGPAGSGKTFRCLAEIRADLRNNPAPDASPLLLVAPKQATYQLERQLLADESLHGYTRLRIVSFERLAEFVLRQSNRPALRLLSEQGRLMVLRALLAKKYPTLKLFHGSARLTGFAQQLSDVLRELQRHQLTPEQLRKLAERFSGTTGLSFKLQDFAMMLEAYWAWLKEHKLQDADCLLDEAARVMRESATFHAPGSSPCLWVDGFTEMSPQQLDLLAALAAKCRAATITFCLDRIPTEKISWLSNWSIVRRAFEDCRERLKELPAVNLNFELLKREQGKSRFENPFLAELEKFWCESDQAGRRQLPIDKSIRLVKCANPEAEAVLAAREILSRVRTGGRFSDATVLVRSLETHHAELERVFRRYEIPFFLDCRESVAHHPLAELTRSALRTVALGWPNEDWFAALKSGLVPIGETDVDRLENEALARGWKRAAWQNPISMADDPSLAAAIEKLRKKIVPPFQQLELNLRAGKDKRTGKELAAALRRLWSDLGVERQLEKWADDSGSKAEISSAVHSTVWEQMLEWSKNLEMAFADEPVSLREWLPVVEAGLGGFTVGVIPPALDQVVIGSVERSRNPDVKLAIVLGLNETLFPAPPQEGTLLTRHDRQALEGQSILLGGGTRQQLGRERFFAYVAFTRARERVVMSYAISDSSGKALNPSPFVSQLEAFFPSLQTEHFSETCDPRESLHVCEITPALMQCADAPWREHVKAPGLTALMERLEGFLERPESGRLPDELAAKLYGATLKTSVSRLEQYAMCPFRFFVHSGLRAEERKLFELDPKEQGSFQHDVLKFFHLELQRQGKHWRDLTPAEARERVGEIARGMLASYRDGLLDASEESRFKARTLIGALQDFIETLVDWMRRQYRFDPTVAELAFGEGDVPAWEMELGGGRRLALRGRIDRVDIFRSNDEEALCAVIDYKSSVKKLEPLLVENGIQLQLLAYLNVVRRWPEPQKIFGVRKLVPAGVFYVNLRGKYDRSQNRADALAESAEARRLAYRHSGRFDAAALRQFDCVNNKGDQFNFALTNSGKIHGRCAEPMQTSDFLALLDSLEVKMKEFGERILSGDARIDPFKNGSKCACDFCSYKAICRIDPWTHPFRELKRAAEEA